MKLQICQRWQCGTDSIQGLPQDVYTAEEAVRYHAASASIQKDLTRLALELLQLPVGQQGLLLDIGCGTGLSAPAGSKQHAGAASKPGGTAAASGPQESSCNRQAGVYPGQAGTMRPLQAFDGGVLLSDMGHGLPLRAASFDGAISISAVQWLCHAAQPELACRRFFGALRHCLKPEAAAILQVYIAGDGESALLLAGARHAGFQAALFVAMPHKSTAKKYFLCMRKAGPSVAHSSLAGEPALQQQKTKLRCAYDSDAHHVRHARRLLRLLRRAVHERATQQASQEATQPARSADEIGCVQAAGAAPVLVQKSEDTAQAAAMPSATCAREDAVSLVPVSLHTSDCKKARTDAFIPQRLLPSGQVLPQLHRGKIHVNSQAAGSHFHVKT
eukprot:jgi/Astpho2/8386/Aster-x1494